MKKFTLLLVLISSSVFAGDPFKEFPGQYYFSTDSDNGVSEMSFRIMGEAGKKMYEGIDQIPERDDCDVSNNLIKYLGNIQCHYNPDDESHICYFGININTGGFGSGISC